MIRRLLSGVAVVMLLLLGGCTGSQTNSEGGFISGDGSITRVPLDQRKPAPVIAGNLLDGRAWSSTSVTGKVIVYNVWGSWCAPCQKEAPGLVKASERTKASAQFIGLNTRDLAVDQAQAFVRNYGINYPNVYDPDGRLLLAFGGQLPPNAIPSTLIVDTQGRIAARILGETTEATVVGLIEDIAAGR